MKKIKNYKSDIDNLTNIKEVRNLMIGPAFAHKMFLKDDNTPIKFDRESPIGII
jgi:hypothetical protein